MTIRRDVKINMEALSLIQTTAVAVIALSVLFIFMIFNPPKVKTTLRIPNANDVHILQKTILSKSPSKPLVIAIYFDNFGFDPNILRVPVGTIIKVINISTKGPLKFEALSGQANQNYSLNLGIINQNQSKSLTITKSGVWQYEGQHNPEIRGVISTGKLSSNIIGKSINPPINNNQVNIIYDDYGFMPNIITVPPGTNITITNTSDNTQPGPMNIQEGPNQPLNPNLNIGFIFKKKSKSFIVNKVGNWIYDDIYQPVPKSLGQINVKP